MGVVLKERIEARGRVDINLGRAAPLTVRVEVLPPDAD
jgi:hypothetical protein